MGQYSGASYRAGVLFGLVAYVWWGLVPLYFREIMHVPPGEILAHRICWSIVLLAGLTAVTGGWADLLRVLRSRRLVLTLLLSATLLAVNWLLYIYATVTGRVSEASLGYYMMPLVNAFLATLFLGERLRPAHYPALALVAVGVAVPVVTAGDFTWIAVAVPVTFAFYGLVRKQIAVDSLTGLSVETILLFVPSLGFLVWQAAHGGGQFGRDWRTDGLLALGGVVTVVPLLMFTLSIRRMPLLANSFMQFLSPTMQFLVAVLVIGEYVSPERWAAIGFVWAAVLLFVADAVMQLRAKRREMKNPSPGPSPKRGGEKSRAAVCLPLPSQGRGPGG
ncbi:MAG TPA: EamA family transporter RarD [Fimbriiglobus sp.]|nr:EamA family transporter RarD [Fimbriiglobus sp.]